jgi:hypothetical protein
MKGLVPGGIPAGAGPLFSASYGLIFLDVSCDRFFGAEVKKLKKDLARKELQTGNPVELAEMGGRDGIAGFEGAGTDQEISQWETDAAGRLFTTYPGDYLGGNFGDRVDWYRSFQVVHVARQMPRPASDT